MEAFATILEFVLDCVIRLTIATVAPLRFIFSSKYRTTKLASWKGRPIHGAVNFATGAGVLLLFLSLAGYVVWQFTVPEPEPIENTRDWNEIVRTIERYLPAPSPGKN